MKSHQSMWKYFFKRLVVAAVLCLPGLAHGQNTIIKGNNFASVQVNSPSGQFIIFKVPGTPLSYYGQYTSHTNFVMTVSGSERIFTTEASPNVVIHDGAVTATYFPPDSIYTVGDSIFAYWKNLFGFNVWQLTYPFLTYSSGQIAIEYRTARWDSSSTNRITGILVELDVFSSDPNSGCGTGADKALILDSRGYEAIPNPQQPGCWIGANAKYLKSDSNTTNEMPQWFHAAPIFPATNGSALSTGKLWGPSRETPALGDASPAPILVEPDEFYVGDWGDANAAEGLKNIGWTVTMPDWVQANSYADCAIIYKWKVTNNNFRCCTVYGPNDDINDNFICNDAGSGTQGIYVNSRFPKRVLHNADGTYTPGIDTLRVWGTNCQNNGGTAHNMQVTLDTTNTCLLLAGSQPLIKNMNERFTNSNTISARNSGYAEYYFRVDTSRCCKPGQTTFHEDTINIAITTSENPNFAQPCKPTVDVQCYTVSDTLPPQYNAIPHTFPNYEWVVSDNRLYDSGIDSIVILLQQNFNVTVPANAKCDKNILSITGNILDTLKKACLTIKLVDCALNRDTIELCINPSPDKTPPKITVADTTQKAIGPSSCPLNFKKIKLLVQENAPFDLGIQSIKAVKALNITAVNEPFNTGALSAYVDATVNDPLFNAFLVIEADDMAGNVSFDTVTYCTIQDTTPPVVSGSINKNVYSFTITEQRPWDRGLFKVDILSQVNCVPTGPTFFGDTLATLSFTIVDTSQDANFCFIARDSFMNDQTDNVHYALDSSHHQTNICGSFTSGIDTMAPIVQIIPTAADGGYSATVIAKDIHYFPDGTLYTRDKGLLSVDFSNPINVDTNAKPKINPCQVDSEAFIVHAADTLSLYDTTACLSVTATDCQGLVSNTATWCYPLTPDTIPPYVTFSDGPTRDQIIFHVKDDRAYDRGLYSVVFDSVVNVQPLSDTGLDGVRSHDETLQIIDTTKPAYARICVTDAYSHVHQQLLSKQQTCFDFNSYIIPIWPDALTVTDGGATLRVKVNIQMPPVDAQLTSVDFLVHHPHVNGMVLQSIDGGNGNIKTLMNANVNPDPQVQTEHARFFSSNAEIDPTTTFLGYLNYSTTQAENILASSLTFDVKSVSFNDYKTRSETTPFVVIPHLAPFGAVPDSNNFDIAGRCKQVMLTPGVAAFALSQNIPNPASSEVKISYSLDRYGPLRLSLCNAVGVPIRTILSTNGTPGTFEVGFDVSDLRSGVYYYRLECNGAVQSRAMSILR